MQSQFQPQTVILPSSATALRVLTPRSTLPLGVSVALTVVAVTPTGEFDVTSAVAWNNSNPAVADLRKGNFLTPFALGNVTLVACASGLESRPLRFTVVDPVPTRLTIVGAPTTLELGASVTLEAWARFSDGSTVDVTPQVSFESTPPELLMFSGARGDGPTITAIAPGSARLRAFGTLAGSGATLRSEATVVTVLPPQPIELQVSSRNPVLFVGEASSWNATLLWSDGTVEDVSAKATWTVDPTGAAIIVAGSPTMVVPQLAGEHLVAASHRGLLSNSATLIANDPVAVSLAIFGPSLLELGESATCSALLTFDNGATTDVTGSVTWSVTPPELLQLQLVDNILLADAAEVGSGTLSATVDGLSSDLEITVTAPAVSSVTISVATTLVEIGSSVPLNALAIDTQGNSSDVTLDASWIVTPATAAAISDGVLTPQQTGSCTIQAQYQGIDSGVLGLANYEQRIAVNVGGAAASLQGVPFDADATHPWLTWTGGNGYSNGTSINGTDDDPIYQTLRYGGDFSAQIVAPIGDYWVQIHAAEIVGGFGSGDRVFDLLIEDTVVAADVDIAAQVGFATPWTHSQLVHVDDGTLDLRWNASEDNAVVSALRVLSLGDFAPQPSGLSLTPEQTTWAAGFEGKLNAHALFTLAGSEDVSDSVIWQSSDTSLLVATSDDGRFLALAPGSAEVTAQFGGFVATATVTVAPALAATAPHQVLEVSLLSSVPFSSESGPNPFSEVDLEALVTSPSGVVHNVTGFFDGDGNGGSTGRVFSLRMSFDEVGVWDFETISNEPGLDATSGSLTCSGIASTLPLTVDPAHPRYFARPGGEPIFLVGKFLDEDAPLVIRNSHTLFSELHTPAEQQSLIARHLDLGVNKFSVYIANSGDYGGFYPTTPWLGSAANPDRSRFDLSRWHQYETLLEQLLDDGFYVHVWFFADDSNFGFLNDEQRLPLIEFGMARLSAYPHLFFQLCLEWEETWQQSTVVSHMQVLQSRNPWQRLASVHGNIGPFDFPNEPWADYIDIQSSQGAAESDTYNAVLTNIALAEKPVLAEEFWKGAELPLGRRKAWAAFFAGAAGVGTGAFLEHLHHYTATYPFADLVADNGRVISGTATARVNAGSDYRFHLRNGGSVTVDVSDASRGLEASFYDPRSGAVIDAGSVAAGVVTFTSPSNEDWILQIR